MRDLSGIDFLQEVIKGNIEYSGMAKLLNMTFNTVSDGYSELETTLDETVNNFMGTVHGGVFATLLDTAMGNAVLTKLTKHQAFATIELDTKLIRPLPHHSRIIIKGQVQSFTRQLAVATGEIVDEQGKLYGTGSCICMIRDERG